MKGTIAITVMGRASREQVSEWKQGIEDIFKPQISRGGDSRDRLSYYLCDSISTDQIQALVTKFGGVVMRKAAADNLVEPALLGEYGNCIFEVPDEGETWRLEAPPNTFRDEYHSGKMPPSLDFFLQHRSDHTHVVLIPNRNGDTVGMDVAVFHFDPSAGSQDAPIPATLDEAVDMLIGLLPPDERKNFTDIPREEVPGRTHFTMGMAIRNSWRLWDKNSPLMRQFPGQQPDDVSSLIIDTAWQKLKDGGD